MRTKNPGFNKENIVVVDADGTNPAQTYPLFKQALAKYPQVQGIASSAVHFGEGYNSTGFEYNGKHVQVFKCPASADFAKVMGMQLVAGSMVNDMHANDTANDVLVNESLVRDMGLTNAKIIGVNLDGLTRAKSIVAGVVKDFNFLPLTQKIQPIVFTHAGQMAMRKYFVRIKPGYPAAALRAMQKTWADIVPDIPFTYSFLDDRLNSLYAGEERWGSIVGWAGAVSVLLACLGLFGLAGLAAVNRTKEIGIRKVLGATVPVIVRLMSKEFLQLVAIAMIIATPLTWYCMDKWLQGYAYRINISAWVFIIAGAMALLVALLTVSTQAIKAAVANPAIALKNE
jgi:putative ABC transport system permease protein